MTNFIINPGEYRDVERILRAEAPAFESSPEFLLLAEPDRELPSVICGAFMRYIARLQSTLVVGVDDRLSAELDEAYRAVERLASSHDPEVVNLVEVDIFEHLRLSQRARDAFIARLGPESRNLYEEHLQRLRGDAG